MKTKISSILQALMQEKNIHTTELARRTNLKQPTVQRIVSGTYEHPHNKTLKPIADFFGLTIDQLTGLKPISWLTDNNSELQRIPIITPTEAINFSFENNFSAHPHIIIEKNIGKKLYAMQMPDSSMEPLFPEDALLIFDAEKTPKDRCYILIKSPGQNNAVFRQYLIDGNNRYIKPLSPDFSNFMMTTLNIEDIILGVLIQARMDYCHN